jgi:hypothetical protein
MKKEPPLKFPLQAATLHQAIENAFTCLKGKHAATKV